MNGTLSVFIVGDRYHAMITLNLGDSGVPVPFQTDSGSECCMLPRHEYVIVTGDKSLAKLSSVKTVIVMYNGAREKALGQCKLSVVRKRRLVFNVLQGKYTPILSLGASEGIGVRKIKDSLCVRVTVHPQHSCCLVVDAKHCFQFSGAD